MKAELRRMMGALWAYGERCRHERYVWFCRRSYHIDESFDIRRYAQVYGDGEIHLGRESYINTNTRLVSNSGQVLRVGSFCWIAENCRIETASADPDHDYQQGESLSPKSADVTIGDYVWIGAGSYIGPGIVIGDGAIVGANSVVHRAVEPNEIVGGSPLRHIRFKRSAQSEASEEN